MSKPLGLRCENCTFWNRDDGLANAGTCTRFPPQVTDEPGPPQFPVTDADVFCAEWSQNDDEMEDGVPHGKLHQELVQASIDVLKAWFGMVDNPEEEKLEPQMEKLKKALMRNRAW